MLFGKGNIGVESKIFCENWMGATRAIITASVVHWVSCLDNGKSFVF